MKYIQIPNYYDKGFFVEYSEWIIVAIVIVTPMFIYLLNRLLNRLCILPKNGKIKSDLERMKNELEFNVDDMAPVDVSKLQTLATLYSQIDHSDLADEAAGMIENMVIYYYKSYWKKSNAVLLVITSEHELLFKFKQTKIVVCIGNEPYGFIDSEGKFALEEKHRDMLGKDRDRLNKALLLFSFMKYTKNY